MIDRRSAWSDEGVQELTAGFILAADEVHALQRREDAEGRLFQKVAEQGHYAGRRQPTGTRQGIYAFAPSGKLLASWNTRRPENVRANLREALVAWGELPEDERYLDGVAPPPARWEDQYPESGLALVAFSRDLPRTSSPDDWRGRAWNIDHAWFTAAEARALAEDGALPEKAARRLVRVHGRDNVRGQTRAFKDGHVDRARLTSRVTGTEGPLVTLELEGEGTVRESGQWRINDRHDAPAQHTRSFAGDLFGRAVWNRESARFVEFELAWAGQRTGATQYNGRADDPGPAPMAVVLVLAPEGDRVAPSHLWEYGKWTR